MDYIDLVRLSHFFSAWVENGKFYKILNKSGELKKNEY